MAVIPRLAGSPALPRSLHATHVSARTQVAVAVVVGALVASAVSVLASPEFWALAAWDTTVLVWMAWVWAIAWRSDAQRTARLADRADPTRAAADLLLLSASVASLVAIGVMLVNAAHAHGAGVGLRVALGLASVVLSWATVHTVFTLRYARLYYTGDDGGVAFNQREPPRYTDFAYLSFTIGMTFQVSDTEFQNDAFRRTALQHGLLSYLFGTGILATAINLVASLSSQ